MQIKFFSPSPNGARVRHIFQLLTSGNEFVAQGSSVVLGTDAFVVIDSVDHALRAVLANV